MSGDDRVATLMWNNAEHVEAYFAIPSMGAVLHTLNLRLPAEQLVWIVGHAADKVVIVDGSLVPLLAPLLPQLPTVEHIVVSGPGDRAPLAGAGARVHEYEELIAGRPTHYDWPELDERQAAAMCYTSGTTGDPKGVVYSHRSVYLHSMQVNMTQSMGLTDQDTSLVVVPQFHVNAWGLPHATFMTGVNMLMPDRFLQPAPLAEMIEHERPTHAAAVPTIWQGLLGELRARPRDVSSLTQVTIGGAACPPSLMAAFDELGMRVCHAWGMTETSPLGTVARPPAHAVGTDEEFSYRVTQGRFPASVEARLTGPDGEHLPWDGESAGELEVRGPWIAGAYYNGPDAEPLRPTDKFSADGWLRTGDVGTISPEGFLTLTDRAKDVIKSGGEWISSVELENALMSHPDVAEAAVVAVPDEKWGAPAGHGRAAARRHRRLRDPAHLPRRGGPHRQVAAARAVDGHRVGPEDQRGQVRQEGAAPGVRGGPAGRHPPLTAPRRHRRPPRTVVVHPSTSHTPATAHTPPQPQWPKAGPATAEARAPPAKPETT